jgi:hypothetical protein
VGLLLAALLLWLTLGWLLDAITLPVGLAEPRPFTPSQEAGLFLAELTIS